MPLCLGTSGSVRASSSPYSPTCPNEHQILLPAHDVVVAVADRPGAQRREVGAGVGLREALAPHLARPGGSWGCAWPSARACPRRSASGRRGASRRSSRRRRAPSPVAYSSRKIELLARRGVAPAVLLGPATSRRSRPRRAAAASRCRSDAGGPVVAGGAVGQLGQRPVEATPAARRGTPRRTRSSEGPSARQCTAPSRHSGAPPDKGTDGLRRREARVRANRSGRQQVSGPLGRASGRRGSRTTASSTQRVPRARTRCAARPARGEQHARSRARGRGPAPSAAVSPGRAACRPRGSAARRARGPARPAPSAAPATTRTRGCC